MLVRFDSENYFISNDRPKSRLVAKWIRPSKGWTFSRPDSIVLKQQESIKLINSMKNQLLADYQRGFVHVICHENLDFSELDPDIQLSIDPKISSNQTFGHLNLVRIAYPSHPLDWLRHMGPCRRIKKMGYTISKLSEIELLLKDFVNIWTLTISDNFEIDTDQTYSGLSVYRLYITNQKLEVIQRIYENVEKFRTLRLELPPEVTPNYLPDVDFNYRFELVCQSRTTYDLSPVLENPRIRSLELVLSARTVCKADWESNWHLMCITSNDHKLYEVVKPIVERNRKCQIEKRFRKVKVAPVS